MFVLCGLRTREYEKSCKDCIFPQGEDSLIQTELYLNELLRTRNQIHNLHISTQATVYFESIFILFYSVRLVLPIVRQRFYSEICVFSDTFGHCFSSPCGCGSDRTFILHLFIPNYWTVVSSAGRLTGGAAQRSDVVSFR